jgi:hypothetical protein
VAGIGMSIAELDELLCPFATGHDITIVDLQESRVGSSQA